MRAVSRGENTVVNQQSKILMEEDVSEKVGSSVPQPELTRDQLYLALRLSALELHLEQTVALPFIADDLFINYDDGRAKAGLHALAKLSVKTQVIFLTHHDHLIPVAQSVFGEKLNVVHL